MAHHLSLRSVSAFFVDLPSTKPKELFHFIDTTVFLYNYLPRFSHEETGFATRVPLASRIEYKNKIKRKP